jgi:hypothetical protein
MINSKSGSSPKSPDKSRKEAARERSAAALRENLKRRKAQARSQTGAADTPETQEDAPTD